MKTLTEKIRIVRQCIDRIDTGAEVTAKGQCEVLSESGFIDGQYTGAKELEGLKMEELTLEQKHITVDWYAGQIISIINKEAWYCVNSLINTCDKFAPVEWMDDYVPAPNDRTQEVEDSLSGTLDECLESFGQEGSFRVIKTDLQKRTFTVEFDIVEVPEDGYIGFAGY